MSDTGPSEPCGDLSAAPFGGGEPQCKCPRGGSCADGGPHCDAQGIGGPGFTGNRPGMLQDDCAGLSKALASKPDARLRAREAAAEHEARRDVQQPVAWMWQHDETGRTGFVDAWQLANSWREANPRLHVTTPLYREPPMVMSACRPPGGWSDSGPVEGTA